MNRNRTLAFPAPFCCVSLCCASVVLLTSGSVYSQAIVGVNLLNDPSRLTVQEQETTLDNMKAAGVRVIRAAIPDDEKGYAFADRVYAHGIAIQWLAGVRSPSGNMILSVADPDKFRAYAQPVISRLETKGERLAGIELGNEINWALWNHDLSGGTGRVLTLEDLTSDPEGRQVAKGYLQYIKVLTVLKDIRDHSQVNQRAPIISAGLAPWEPPSTGSKNDAVSLKATIQFLRANGLDTLVDDYGIHWYPPGGTVTPAARLAAMRDVFAECGTGGSGGKPCWLTEWGLPVTSGSHCPVVDDRRTAIFSDLRNDFKQFVQQGRLKGIMFFAWQGNPHEEGAYNAFLCGSLTKSGKLAISPL